MLEIRKANLDDILLIRDLAHRTWPNAYKDILSTEQLSYMLELIYSAGSLEEQITKFKHQFLFILESNTPIGFAAYSLFNDPSNFRLHKFYILPTEQGKGLGKFLLEYLVDEIKSKGGIRLELNVNRHNRAISFYKKLGFEIVSNEDIDIGNGYFMNDFVMLKVL